MRLCIVGGGLQGMEATYLAKRAKIETVVVDRNPRAPALSMGDESVVMDVVSEEARATRIYSDCDAVIPTNEDMRTLRSMVKLFRGLEVPLIHDQSSYEITSSKLSSNELMERLSIPMPSPWPECGFPVVIKPSRSSGSHGVYRANGPKQLSEGKRLAKRYGHDYIIQEFVDGPSISMEVISNGYEAVPMITTQLYFDETFDCKMVCSPARVERTVADCFRGISEKIAAGIGLKGIMDVEAMVSGHVPKVIEIDARLPSQTPSAIFHSHGVNMVEVLVRMFVNSGPPRVSIGRGRSAIYEHVMVKDGILSSRGEGIMRMADKPRVVEGLFGADVVITDYEPGKETWVATLICTGSTPRRALEKRENCLDTIMVENGIFDYYDSHPHHHPLHQNYQQRLWGDVYH